MSTVCQALIGTDDIEEKETGKSNRKINQFPIAARRKTKQ